MSLFQSVAADPNQLHLYKLAAPDVANTRELEQQFGQLALSFVKDRAPLLIPHMVGFEVIEQEPDGTKGVGVFGFSIDDKMWAVPCFFMQGQLKGMDMLYSVKDSQMYPLTEAWVSKVVSKQSFSFGETAKLTDNQRGSATPDYSWASSYPGSGSSRGGMGVFKQGQVTLLKNTGWFDKIAESVAESVVNDPEVAKMVAGAVLVLSDAPDTSANTKLASLLARPETATLARRLRSWFDEPAFAKAASYFGHHRDDFVVVPPFTPGQYKVATDLMLVERDYDAPLPGKAVSSDDDKTRTKAREIVSRGFYLDDRRKKDKLSETADPEQFSASQIYTPTSNEKATLLLAGGMGVEATIIATPLRLGCRHEGPLIGGSMRNSGGSMALVPGGKGGVHTALTHATNKMFLLGQESNDKKTTDKDPVSELYDKAKSLADVKVGEAYVLVTATGTVSEPFEVDRLITERGGKVVSAELHVWGSYDDARLRLVERSGSLQVTPGQGWRVPATIDAPMLSCRALPVGRNTKNEGGAELVLLDNPDLRELFKLGSFNELQVSYSPAGVFAITLNNLPVAGALSYKSAAVQLTRDMHLAADTATAMLKRAEQKFKSRMMIKFAQGVSFPPPTEDQLGVDPDTGVPIQEPVEEELVGDSNYPEGPAPAQPGLDDPVTGTPPGDVTALAQNAARTGQSTVFDHGVLGGLTRTYDVGNAIDGLLPSFMKALDGLGRTLFLFYWKNTEFAERYGVSELTELEDHLRATFKQFGDLVLSLSRKSVEPSPGSFVDPSGPQR